MAIWHVNISNDRQTYCAHLKDEERLFFLVPIQKDDSVDWATLQAWLDAGNEIVDDMCNQDTYYKDMRRSAYPSVVDQLDYIYHNGVDAWKSEMIDPVKAQFPKPEGV